MKKKNTIQALRIATFSLFGATRQVDNQLKVLASVLAVIGAISLILVLPLIWLGLKRGLSPLHQLASEVAMLDAEHLSERINEKKYPTELEVVTHGLNSLLARLESSFDRERRFSSHAAHELKTPLAEIRSLAEIGAMFTEEASPERCSQIVEVTHEMELTLSKLALLSRVESAHHELQIKELGIEESLETMLDRNQEEAAERSIKFNASRDIGYLRVDETLWNAIFQNLLGNAIAHAPPGSTINITLSEKELIICNPAPDLEEADIDFVFERFWQKNSSPQKARHSGLGLPIVQACASLMGCDIEPRPVDSQFRVRIIFKDRL